MSKRKWLLPLLLSLPLAAVILFLGGCLPVGLGDPEASKIDLKLVGAWQDEGDGVVVLLPFDGRAYLMRTLEVERTEEGIELEPGEGCYKAWLTTIEGRTFLTAQPLYLREAVQDGKVPGLFVAAVKLSDDGSRIEARAIDPDFPALAPLKTMPGHMSYEPGGKAPTEEEAKALLRKVVAENAGNDKLYIEDLAKYARVTDKALLKAIFEGVIG